jgi:cystathionine beta-lyase/cystathionine gamma-synthase
VHYGGVLSPFNAWLILRGAATLPIRMKAHEETARAVAGFLEAHPKVERVFWPGLPSHPQHALAARQMRNFSGMMSFRLHEDGRTVAKRMIDRLEVIHYAVSLGHHRSLITWIDTAALMASTVPPLPRRRTPLPRLRRRRHLPLSPSALEDPEDICADLDRVLYSRQSEKILDTRTLPTRPWRLLWECSRRPIAHHYVMR